MTSYTAQNIGEIVHASCVAFCTHGVLISAPSARGKSTLALELISRGATLVADDRTVLSVTDNQILASPPAKLSGIIEVRGIGLLRAKSAAPVRLGLIIDLEHTEPLRHPPKRIRKLMGLSLPVLYRIDSSSFPAAILQYLAEGLYTDEN